MGTIRLGMYVRDDITGFKGPVTAKTEYLNREPCYLIESVDNTGRPIEWWIDENRLTIIGKE